MGKSHFPVLLRLPIHPSLLTVEDKNCFCVPIIPYLNCYMSMNSFLIFALQYCTLLLSSYITCVVSMQVLQWSPDSSLLLTGIPSSLAADSKSAVLQVWCLTDPEWRCCLELGSAGLLTATWSPDSRHLLVTELLHVSLKYVTKHK